MPPRRSAVEQPPAGPAPPPPGWGKNVQKKKWFPEGLQWSVTSMVFFVRRHFNKKFGRRTPRSSTLHRFTNPSVTAWIWSTSSHQDRISTPSLCTTEGKLAREIFVLAPPRRDQHLCLRRKCCVLRIFLRALLVLVDISLASRAPGGDSESREGGEQRNKGIKRSTRKGGQAFVYEYRRGPSFEAGTGTRARVLAEPLELGW